MPVNGVVRAQAVIYVHRAQGHAAAHADGLAVKGADDVVRRLPRGGEFGDGEAVGAQVVYGLAHGKIPLVI